MPAERRICRFTGHVQGVGFRYTAQSIAQQFAVTGFVRNLPDRRVELIAEGEPHALDAFIQSIQERMEQFIRKVDTSTQPATGEFSGFTVRH